MPLVRLLRNLRVLAALVATAGAVSAADPAPPRVAIAPVAREYLDGQESLGESLTPLLLAALSDDPRWTLVERADLGPLEAEWTLGGSASDQSALAVAQGRLLGADWSLVLHPDLRTPEHPLIRIEIIDTLRSEPLDVRVVPLRHRPRARWFRNPPADDLEALLPACQAGLAHALAVRAARAPARVAALLFFKPEPGSGAVPALAADLETRVVHLSREAFAAGRRDWRFLEAPNPEVTHGEALLRTAGFIGEQAPTTPAADAFVWGWYRTTGANETTLRFRIWPAREPTDEHLARGTPAEIAATVFTALAASAPETDDAGRRALAQSLVAEAHALAPTATQSSENADACRRLLALAALLAPTDREIQELRLIAARHALPPGPEATLPRRRLGLEYARLADHFWRGPEERYDLRLLTDSFLATGHTVPGQRARALRAAPVLARIPATKLQPHVALFEQWVVYCRAPDADSFALLEVALPVIARFRPERLQTKLNGFVGILPTLLETYHDENRARLLGIVARLPRAESAPDPIAADPAHLVPANSPAPELRYPRESPQP